MLYVGNGAGEFFPQRRQVEGAVAFMDLHAVAAAHGDVRLGVTLEIGKFTANAGAAMGIAFDLDGLEATGPDIGGDQAVVEGLVMAGEEFHGFGDFQRGDQIDDGTEDSDSVAGFLYASGRIGTFEQASEAWGRARKNGHGEAIAGDGGGVDPGLRGSDGEIVDEETRFEVVSAVEDEVETAQEFRDVPRVDVGDQTFDGDGGVDAAQLALGGYGFG